jgi:hypothetical protein
MTTRLFVMVLVLVVAPSVRMGAQSQTPTPANPQNRLSAITEEQMTEPLRRALAEYRQVRPDGLGGARGVGAGGPSLWTVYVYLPEILGPIRQLHEQAHVNPRISQNSFTSSS